VPPAAASGSRMDATTWSRSPVALVKSLPIPARPARWGAWPYCYGLVSFLGARALAVLLSSIIDR
jgi:hypothetical protein